MSLDHINFESEDLWQLYDAGEDDSLAIPNQGHCLRLLDGLAEADDPGDLAYQPLRQEYGEYYLDVDDDYEIRFVWRDGHADEIELVAK